MEKTTKALAARLRPQWNLHEPGTGEARATQATLGFWLVLLGATAGTVDTLLGSRPHPDAILATCAAGFALALVLLVRYDRMGVAGWHVAAACGGVLVSTATILDPAGWAIALLISVFFVGFIAFFFEVWAFLFQLLFVLTGVAGAMVTADSTGEVIDWLLAGLTLLAVGWTVVAGKGALRRALDDLRRQAARQEQTAALGASALAEPDIWRVMKDAVELVAEELAIDDAVVLERLPSSQGLLLRTSHIPLPEGASPLLPVGAGSFSGYTMLADEPVVSEDLATESRFTPTALLLESGMTSAANVVIPGIDGAFGVLGVRSRTRRHFAEDDLVFLQSVANIVGAATSNRAIEQTLERTESGASVLSERLQALIDASPLAIVELDPQGRVKLWNRAAEQTFGWTRDEVLGLRYPIVPPEERGAFDDMIAGLLAGGGIDRIEGDRMRKDGSHVRCEVHGAAIRNDEGKATSFIAIIADISERVRTERELARSRELYKTVVENSRDMIAVLDLDGRYVYASPAYQTVLGHAPEKLVGSTPEQLVHPDDWKAVARDLERARDGGTATVETRVRRADGEWGVVESTITAVRDEQGRLQALLATTRDLSERRAAEEELTQAELRYRTLVEELPLITYVHAPDAHDGWSYLSPQLEALLGYTEYDWKDDPGFYEAILDPRDRSYVIATRAAMTGRLSLEYRVRAVDGRSVWIRDEAVIVRDVAGRALYVQGYMLDVTAEQDAERKRKALEAQLLQSQKMEAVGRLAGGIAHDFNNLLTAITGYSHLVLNGLPEGSEAAQDLEQIRRAAGQAASMTQQLLAFSRRQVLQPTVISLNDVIEEMEPLLNRLIGETITLVTDCDPSLLAVRSDRSQIEQVVMNLSVNARDAMPRGGRLVVRTANVELSEEQARAAATDPGPHVLLEVSDTGHGMDPETLEHAFEPFFTTKDQGKGTGLGLSTVHGIVQQSGGGISVESEIGRGTTFRISLPAVDKAVTVGERVPDQPGRGHETILLVEDERIVRELIARVLRGQGYDVVEAPAGEAALKTASELDRVDLLLTDVVMPGLSGRELSERLAALRPELRILFMSGYTDEAIVHHGVRAGEAEFLAKPFTPDALARKVRAVLDAVLERA